MIYFEIKFPKIWRDGRERWEKSRKEDKKRDGHRRERVGTKQVQAREKVKVETSRFCAVFSMI